MRVVAGSARGRLIVAPQGTIVRPTADRVRQATFNSLESRTFVAGATVVDLFAGTGALGLEALSRGARHATFVDSERLSVECIRQNAAHLGFETRCQVVRSDALQWLQDPLTGFGAVQAFAVEAGAPLLVLADPPYAFTDWARLLALLLPFFVAAADDSILVLESARSIDVQPGWELEREQRYGAAVVTMVRPVPTDPVPPMSMQVRAWADTVAPDDH